MENVILVSSENLEKVYKQLNDFCKGKYFDVNIGCITDLSKPKETFKAGFEHVLDPAQLEINIEEPITPKHPPCIKIETKNSIYMAQPDMQIILEDNDIYLIVSTKQVYEEKGFWLTYKFCYAK